MMKERMGSYCLVEEFMLLANRAAAERNFRAFFTLRVIDQTSRATCEKNLGHVC
ncbi:hypothetical protein KSP39_PZI006893 [Platanthera zijinensis]|uniref:Uncharacterized protein n=1 Tax=Platanthera zijinensis TaxID=2320716 RepID=A0AAP0BR89_9ASPA